MDENGQIISDEGPGTQLKSPGTEGSDLVTDEAIDVGTPQPSGIINNDGFASASFANGVKTLDGGIAEDKLEKDALNHQILLNKIDLLLDRLKLDA